MGLYIQRRCPKCNYKIEPYTRNYIAVASPVEECPNCKTYVKFSNRNEWQLMGIFKKAEYYFVTTFTGLFYSMIPLLVILFLEIDMSEITTLLVSAVIGELVAFYQLTIVILESNHRMENLEYRERLKYLGLL